MDNVIIDSYKFLNGFKYYLIYAILLSFIIRLFLSIFRALEISRKRNVKRGFFYYLFKSIIGFDKNPSKGDYWVPFLIGVIELMIFPFLINSGLWVGIAFWITLKTAAQWDTWKNDRRVFNRFLLGTACVLILSFSIMCNFVEVELKDNCKDSKTNIENIINTAPNKIDKKMPSN